MVTSDYLSHDKYAVHHFNDLIIRDLQNRMKGKLKVVDFFSDGAAQHFKQRYTFFSATLFHQQDIQVNWHFFATSHGKGAVDGVGGSVKRAVCNAVKTRRYHVSNASEYAACAEKVLDKIIVLYVPSADIEVKKTTLDNSWLDVKSVPGTHDIHCIRSVGIGEIQYSLISDKPGQFFQLLKSQASNASKTVVPTVKVEIPVLPSTCSISCILYI